MDRLKLVILYLFVPVSVSVVVFLSIYASGFCSSLALSQGATQSLGSSLGNVFDFSSISASPDPVGMSIGLSQIYDQLDLYLYQNYNYDLSGTVNNTLETGSPYLNVTDDIDRNFVSSITNNVYQSMQELTGAGWAFYKCVTNSLNNAKDTFFIGKAENGSITDTLSPALVYVDDDVLSMYNSSISNSVQDDILYNFSQANHFLYGKTFHFVNNSTNNTLVFSQDVVLCSGQQNYIFIISKYNVGDTIPCTGVKVMNGNNYPISYAMLDTYYSHGDFTIDNETYYYGALKVQVSYGSSYVSSATTYGSINSTIADMRDTLTNNGSVAGVYSLSPDIDSLLKDILAELKGHYVSTDDLEAILDSLQNNGVINNENLVIDEQTQNVPVFDLTSDYLTTLEELVDSILDKSAIYDEVIDDSNSVTPDPNPNYNNQGIAIPPNFNNNIITNVSNIIGLPLQFVSMFSPIFMVFGSNVPLFGLWLFFPIVLIIGVIIWVLK